MRYICRYRDLASDVYSELCRRYPSSKAHVLEAFEQKKKKPQENDRPVQSTQTEATQTESKSKLLNSKQVFPLPKPLGNIFFFSLSFKKLINNTFSSSYL